MRIKADAPGRNGGIFTDGVRKLTLTANEDWEHGVLLQLFNHKNQLGWVSLILWCIEEEKFPPSVLKRLNELGGSKHGKEYEVWLNEKKYGDE